MHFNSARGAGTEYPAHEMPIIGDPFLLFGHSYGVSQTNLFNDLNQAKLGVVRGGRWGSIVPKILEGSEGWDFATLWVVSGSIKFGYSSDDFEL